MNQKQVLKAIRSAFGYTPAPAGIPVPRVLPTPLRAAANMNREAFLGKNWWDLNPQSCRDYPDFRRYMQPRDTCYYLPAYLVGALNDLPNEALLRSTVEILKPSYRNVYFAGGDLELRDLQRHLSKDQYQAVTDFLIFVFERVPNCRHAAAHALSCHWVYSVDETTNEAISSYHDELSQFSYPAPEDQNAAKLVRRIQTAFADTPMPKNWEFVYTLANDTACEAAFDLRRSAWQTVHPKLLQLHHSALCHLSDVGFRYYLPAYMTADLCGWRTNAVFHLIFRHCDTLEPLLNLPVDWVHRVDEVRYRALEPHVNAKAAMLIFDQEPRLKAICNVSQISTADIAEMLSRIPGPVSELEPGDFPGRSSRERFTTFSREERGAVIEYLKFRADEFGSEEVSQALERYWFPSMASSGLARLARASVARRVLTRLPSLTV